MVSERHVRIDLGYDGRHYYGSQRQPNVRTVQEELERTIAGITQQEPRLAFAGRTDRGVHAIGQVASGSVSWTGDLERLRHAIDSRSPEDLRVYRVSDAEDGFHARFSASRREYRYRVLRSDLAPVLLRGLMWPVRKSIDLNRLNDASKRLVGERDFRSFTGAGQGAGSATTNTKRSLDVAEWRRLDNLIEPGGELYEFRVRANAFLPHMVRNLAGALIEIGTGERPAEWIDELLERRDRTIAPPPAPPEGLILWSVEYHDEVGTNEKPGHVAGQEQE